MADAPRDLPVEVKLDEQTYAQLKRDLEETPRAIDRVLTAAVNHAAQRGKTVVVDGIYAELNTKRTEIRTRISVRKATSAKPTAKIVVGKSRINLKEFGAKDTTDNRTHTGQGVFVQVWRSGGTKNYARAFIAKYRGELAVLQRKEGEGVVKQKSGLKRIVHAGSSGLVGRLPLITKVGPSPADALRDKPEIETRSKEKIALVLREQVLSQIDRVLQRPKAERPSDEL